MTNKDLANIIFPDITKTIEDYKNMYPARNLEEGAKVTRFAPSPTGFMHLGGFYQAIIDKVLAHSSNGIFYLRNEDTDQAREIEGAAELIMETLNEYDMTPNEYELESAVHLLNKKIKSGDDLEKAKRFLLNKGYSYSNVSKAIDNLENIEDN